MKPGDVVFDVEVPGSSRNTIALFSQATEDPNPIHVDDAFAKRCGFPQVIQQGPMTTAQFARLLVGVFGSGRLRTLDVSFSAPVFPLESLQLLATVSDVPSPDALRIDLVARKADGTVTARGTAEVTPS
ncbi:MaoC family dehydratase [Hydrogenophaga sp.]|jgi:acyl dehydratase|uniref:MaoC family dehydratase n=1 Tax=Hydrogenophaga sp. TaxID=1904254 RepID=UPI003AF9556F